MAYTTEETRLNGIRDEIEKILDQHGVTLEIKKDYSGNITDFVVVINGRYDDDVVILHSENAPLFPENDTNY